MEAGRMSTIKVDTIQDTSGNEQFTAKAWVNFNGTGTVAIRDSGNVSSLTDGGTGIYTVNFANSMSNASFSASGVGGGTMPGNGSRVFLPQTYTTSSLLFYGQWQPTSAYFDAVHYNVVAHGTM
jgi:hypothetical protein